MSKKSFPMAVVLFMTICFVYTIPSGESVTLGEGGSFSPDGNHFPVIILSENANNKVIRLWALPEKAVSVVYDQWNILIHGNLNDAYKVKINGFEAFNGSMVSNYLNLSFDASALNNARVTVQIGNSSYQFENLIINHQYIGVDGVGGVANNPKYTSGDISRASLRSAFGVVLASVLTIPLIWKGVKIWRNKQGVNQW